jgi:hypothetical protein
LVASQGAVPDVIWLVVPGGAAVTIGFTFFFGAEILRAQVVMTALLAMVIFSELLIIIAIDRPFTGAVKVEPNAPCRCACRRPEPDRQQSGPDRAGSEIVAGDPQHRAPFMDEWRV